MRSKLLWSNQKQQQQQQQQQAPLKVVLPANPVQSIPPGTPAVIELHLRYEDGRVFKIGEQVIFVENLTPGHSITLTGTVDVS